MKTATYMNHNWIAHAGVIGTLFLECHNGGPDILFVGGNQEHKLLAGVLYTA